jgi:hypothetical protein
MLGLYISAALREFGYKTVYCSGIRARRSPFIDRFGAIPLYNGKSFRFGHAKVLVHVATQSNEKEREASIEQTYRACWFKRDLILS